MQNTFGTVLCKCIERVFLPAKLAGLDSATAGEQSCTNKADARQNRDGYPQESSPPSRGSRPVQILRGRFSAAGPDVHMSVTSLQSLCTNVKAGGFHVRYARRSSMSLKFCPIAKPDCCMSQCCLMCVHSACKAACCDHTRQGLEDKGQAVTYLSRLAVPLVTVSGRAGWGAGKCPKLISLGTVAGSRA